MFTAIIAAVPLAMGLPKPSRPPVVDQPPPLLATGLANDWRVPVREPTKRLGRWSRRGAASRSQACA
jgi:hypothetical protein